MLKPRLGYGWSMVFASLVVLSTSASAQHVECVHGHEISFENLVAYQASDVDEPQYFADPDVSYVAEAETYETEASHATELWGDSKSYDPIGDCCICYRWRVRADALFLDRDAADPLALVFGPPHLFGGPQLLNTQQLGFNTRPGGRVSLTRCINECTSLEVNYFGIDGWRSITQIAGDISVQFPGFIHVPLGAPPFGTATFDYGSDLYSFELNLLRRRNPDQWMTWILGARYLELNEDFNVAFTTGGATSRYSISTDNRLLGLQVGGEAHIWQSGSWNVDAWLKAGVYNNSASQSTFVDAAAIGGAMGTVGAADDQVSFLGEVGLSVLYQLTCRLGVRAGYQAMWLERVALAPEQLDNTNIAIPLATLDASGSLFFHGGFIGLEGIF